MFDEPDHDHSDVGEGLGDHERADDGNGAREHDDGDVEPEGKDDHDAHEDIALIGGLFRREEAYDDDAEPDEREGDVARDTPDERALARKPVVLGEGAEDDSSKRKRKEGDPARPRRALIGLPDHLEDEIKDDVEARHGDGGDEFAQPQRKRIGFDARGQQRIDTRDEVKGVPRREHHRHNAEQFDELAAPFYDEINADGESEDEIRRIEKQLHYALNHVTLRLQRKYIVTS